MTSCMSSSHGIKRLNEPQPPLHIACGAIWSPEITNLSVLKTAQHNVHLHKSKMQLSRPYVRSYVEANVLTARHNPDVTVHVCASLCLTDGNISFILTAC